MKPVIQQDATGCGIAAVAAIAGVSYEQANRMAASLGISVTDDRLWSETALVRRLLARYRRRVSSSPQPFRSWEALPHCALLAIKWHRNEGRARWHWVVFVREQGRACVLDSKRGLSTPVRRDFGRMKPKWYLCIPS
jgi:hypothetical protein